MVINETAVRQIFAAGGVPLARDTDFHTLNSSQVGTVLEAAKICKYRKPKNANGSAGRYFFEACKRKFFPAARTEYIVQGNYGHGWEDECSEDSAKECRKRLREYRDNGPGSYRMINRRIKVEG